MIQYQTVFIVAQKAAPWWVSAVVPAIVGLCTALAIVAFAKLKTRRVTIVIAYLLMVFMALVLSPAGVADMYARARDTYAKGEYATVEGAVSNFHPMPYSGHENETFSVNGVRFSYSDYVVSPCFNNTASHGGPIREGLRVRIAYSGDCILRLEVANIRGAVR
jgi:energy-coupling factor transporter transmembrane protein EcfT